MKSFMSAALQDTEAPKGSNPKGATECNSCNGGAVTTTGQESTEAATAAPAVPKQEELTEKNAVVMQGPLGTAITEALNKSLSKKALIAPVQAATESFINNVQANGQVKDTPTDPAGVARISKAVGLVPTTDDAPTTINTLLDCAAKVDDIEFIMVNKVESDPSPATVPQKSILQIYGADGIPANESIAIESVQVVVTYKKLKG